MVRGDVFFVIVSINKRCKTQDGILKNKRHIETTHVILRYCSCIAIFIAANIIPKLYLAVNLILW